MKFEMLLGFFIFTNYNNNNYIIEWRKIIRIKKLNLIKFQNKKLKHL